MSMNNTPAQLYLFNVTTHILRDSGKVGCGFVLAAYDAQDALDTVDDFLSESWYRIDVQHDPAMFLGLASDEIEHGMIMSHIPD